MQLNSPRIGLVHLAAVSLFSNTNMAAVTSCETALLSTNLDNFKRPAFKLLGLRFRLV